ncbi:MAG: UDP-N-acetylmuramoyl-tripeptide--D-alanyl-D-alanine ligase [Gemmatimonadales bacterium]
MTEFAWTAHLVTEALGLPAASWDHAYTGLSTDTRTLKDGELFVALKGEKFDAHDYLSDARLAGVGGVIVREGTPRWPGFDWFEVKDTLVALGQLARLRRTKFTGTLIAVTGSNGKTSTKEMIAAALGVTRKVHKSERNLNNLVGVPLTLLAAPLDAEAMVVECGASVRGELGRMREIVRPDIAVVTNVGAAHVEGFGSLLAVLEEKVSLLNGARIAVVGTEPDALPEAARRLAEKVVTAAVDGPADWTAEQVTMSPDGRASFTVRGIKVDLPMRGRHMVANALIALATADAAGVKLERAAQGIARASLPGGRSELVEMDGVTVINDSYNANPGSLRAALDLLGAVRGARRTVVVLGTMRELGAESARLHREGAEAVLAAKPDVVAAVGEFVPAFESLKKKAGPELVFAKDADEVAPRLKDVIRAGDVVLLKASRGVALEKVIPVVWPNFQRAEAH